MIRLLSCPKLYETEAMRTVCRNTARPGGFNITERAVDFCEIKPGVKLLDVGCGMGASVEYLIKNFDIQAKGIDPSEVMLDLGHGRNPKLPILFGCAERIPFPDKSMEVVLSECSLSQVADVDKALQEFSRILEEEGLLIISDMYIRQQEVDIGDEKSLFSHQLSKDDEQQKDKLSPKTPSPTTVGFMRREDILKNVISNGFLPVLWEDHSDKLIQLLCDIIMEFGSMSNFWSRTGIDENQWGSSKTGEKIGYYLLIARKMMSA